MSSVVFLFFYFIIIIFIYLFILLYNIVLVLPYIDMNLPWVYMCSPSWTSLPPPSPSHPSGSFQCTSPEHTVSCIKSGLMIRFTYDILHVSMAFSHIIPPSSSPTKSKRLFNTYVPLLVCRQILYCLCHPEINLLAYCLAHISCFFKALCPYPSQFTYPPIKNPLFQLTDYFTFSHLDFCAWNSLPP